MALLTTTRYPITPYGWRAATSYSDIPAGLKSAGKSPLYIEDSSVLSSINKFVWRLARKINTEVNSQLRYQEAGGDIDRSWNVVLKGSKKRNGNCVTSAVTKRHRLIEEGIPAAYVPLALCDTEKGERHLVCLLLESTEDVHVLDNRYHRIKPWYELQYKWICYGPYNNQWYRMAG